MSNQTSITFNDGNTIPQVGLGVWQVTPQEAAASVKHALQAGYRHVDTAKIYENESGVGEGVRASGLKREDVFVTTKVWNDNQGFDATLRACERSLAELKMDYVDLYLIHWPSPQRGLYVDTWKALAQLKQDGRVKSIGVSNFAVEHLDRIISETGVIPAINQIELHPAFQQRDLRAYHARHGIATESWSPLGQGKMLTNPVIVETARKHGKTPAQIIIRWHIDNDLVVIPKSVTPSRISENFDVFSFRLHDEDLSALANLDRQDGRIGPDPLTATF